MTTASLLLVAAVLSAAPRGVVLDFSAAWCGPCQQMSPIVSKLERQGYPIYKVDVDQQRDLARKYNITSIPAFVLVVDGEELDRVVGMTTESTLQRMLARIPKTAPDPVPVEVAAAEEPAPKATAAVPAASPPPAEPKRSFFQFPPFGNSNRTAAASASLDQPPPVIRANQFDNGAEGSSVPVVDPLASTVRIRIKDSKGVNFGSGTMIDSRPGNTVILTCGHIFKELTEASVIEVDVFQQGTFRTYAGKTLAYDLESDVGLIAVPTDGVLPTSKVIAAGLGVKSGQDVFSIGCDGGEPPTRQNLKVTALNRYLGPDNIECTGVPVQGRSGGGLFAADGSVVGVCVAADTKEQRGLYAGVKAMHDLLNQARMSRLFRTSVPEGESAPADAENLDDARVAALAAGFGATSAATPAEVEEAMQNAGEAEVICIIRPRKNPQAHSRVVIINSASPKFVSYLTQEIKQQPQPTSHSVPWDEMPASSNSGKAQAVEGVPAGSSTAHRFGLPKAPEAASDEVPQRFRRTPQ